MNTPNIRFKGFSEDWEQRKLGDVVGVYDGTHQTPNYQNSGVMFVSVEDIQTLSSEKYISEEDYKRNYSVVPEKGDILMTRIGDIGTANIVEKAEPLAFYVSLALLKNRGLNAEFLKANISAPEFQNELWLRTLHTAYPKKINKDEIGKCIISIAPCIDEQKQIGNFFEKIDNLIALHQRKCDSLKQVKKYMLQKMFPKQGEKVPEIRFAGFTEDWKQRKLGEIVERITRKNADMESTLPLTISAQYGLIDQNEFFDKRIASKDVSGYYLVYNGEFAYNKSTSSDAPWGAIKRLDRYEKGVLSTLYIVFAIKDNEKTDSDYLTTYYDSSLWHKEVQAIAAEGARNHGLLNISPSDFFETKLSIPSNIEEQRKIGSYFRNLDNLINLHQRKSDSLKEIKKFMLQNMFPNK